MQGKEENKMSYLVEDARPELITQILAILSEANLNCRQAKSIVSQLEMVLANRIDQSPVQITLLSESNS